VPLTVKGGAVEEWGRALPRRAGARRTRVALGPLRHGEATVAPPPGTIGLSVSPSSPVKGRNDKIEVEIAVPPSEENPLPTRVRRRSSLRPDGFAT
jgi:hypothetical protein